jgi:hypothetical protein
VADFIRRKLTPIEEAEYRHRCGKLTEQHMAAFNALLTELGIVIHAGEAYKLIPSRQNEDNYEAAV